ncbi:hypothetical protein GA0070606_4974 [Micromonospora citrea]|uniref:Uncharacterized protein n=1 Tax=Micromonospora citrea TaxID=47855 RepID=A0A1C6VSK4_9ACTN|nr:McrC family protein [Micromonospora citrea]SCL69094.1 hypothetical protein GA0070606_4974 [Micromonospora citrea]
MRAGRKIGAARIGRVELHIEPKVPIARLLFLVGYARNPKGWRDESVSLTEHDGLVPALAAALSRQTDRTLRQGPLHRSRSLAARARGRRRITAGAPPPRRAARRGHPAAAGEPVPDWRPTRLNERLRIVLRLAELVLAGASVEAGRGGVLSNAFLLDSGGSSIEDAYQMLAYCVAYGLTHGHLIYASGDRHRSVTSSATPGSRSSAMRSTSTSTRASLLARVDALAGGIAGRAVGAPAGG